MNRFTVEDRLEFLSHASDMVARAHEALTDAERTRRIAATRAHRAGVAKVLIADALGVSRPTLDAWIMAVESTPAEIDQVVQDELQLQRLVQKRAGAR